MARRRIALAMALVAGCSGSDVDVKGEESPVEHLDEMPTTTEATPTTEASTTTTVPPTVATLPPVAAVERAPAALPPQVHVPSSAPVPELDAAPPAGASVTGAGKASWYARGARTANGEAFEPDGFTAAHRTLAFGTRLNVCHDGRCIEVRINDRGPALWTGRVIDLSRSAFAAIAPLGVGVVEVTWTEAA